MEAEKCTFHPHDEPISASGNPFSASGNPFSASGNPFSASGDWLRVRCKKSALLGFHTTQWTLSFHFRANRAESVFLSMRNFFDKRNKNNLTLSHSYKSHGSDLAPWLPSLVPRPHPLRGEESGEERQDPWIMTS